jgi:hypothetical protein
MGAAPTVVAALTVSGSDSVVRAPASRHALVAAITSRIEIMLVVRIAIV